MKYTQPVWKHTLKHVQNKPTYIELLESCELFNYTHITKQKIFKLLLPNITEQVF